MTKIVSIQTQYSDYKSPSSHWAKYKLDTGLFHPYTTTEKTFIIGTKASSVFKVVDDGSEI